MCQVKWPTVKNKGGHDSIETDEAVNSQIETNEASKVVLNQTGHESFIGPDSIETDEAVNSQIETSELAEVVWNQTGHESFIGHYSIETDEAVNSQIETSESAEVVLNQSDHESFIGHDFIETDKAVNSPIETSESAEVVSNQSDHESFIGPVSIQTGEAGNSHTGTDNEDFDDSLNDPDYLEDGSDLTDSTDISDDDLSCFSGKRKSPDNVFNQQKKQKTVKTCSYYATEYVSDSGNESCASDIIPNMSKFLTDESSYVSCENQEEGTQPCTSTLSKKESYKNGQFGLLPKKDKQTGCKQVYDKNNYCTYCMKAISSKISRHILCVHKAESRVGDILTLPKRSPTRMAKLEVLANEGNFKHNVEVLKKKRGFLVVGRRDSNVRDYKSGM